MGTNGVVAVVAAGVNEAPGSTPCSKGQWVTELQKLKIDKKASLYCRENPCSCPGEIMFIAGFAVGPPNFTFFEKFHSFLEMMRLKFAVQPDGCTSMFILAKTRPPRQLDAAVEKVIPLQRPLTLVFSWGWPCRWCSTQINDIREATQVLKSSTANENDRWE